MAQAELVSRNVVGGAVKAITRTSRSWNVICFPHRRFVSGGVTGAGLKAKGIALAAVLSI